MKGDLQVKKVLVFVLAVVLSFSCVFFCAPAFAAEITIRVGSIVSDAHVDMIAMREVFVPEVEEGSNGRIRVELFPNAQLGGDRELTEAVQLGTLHMAIPASSPLAGFERRIQVLDLPYLFTSREAAFEALDGELGQKLNEFLMEAGFWNLGFQENGIRHVTNNRSPIRSPDDLRGLRIRTMENPMHLAYFRELGANPTPMSWGELYTALQQGVVDAQENPYVMIYDGRFYEVQRYVSETGHFFSAKLLIANRRFIENLPEDLRDVVIQAGQNFSLAQRRLSAERESEFKARLIENGMQHNTLTDEELAPFIAAAARVYEQFEGILGEEIMDIVRRLQ